MVKGRPDDYGHRAIDPGAITRPVVSREIFDGVDSFRKMSLRSFEGSESKRKPKLDKASFLKSEDGTSEDTHPSVADLAPGEGQTETTSPTDEPEPSQEQDDSHDPFEYISPKVIRDAIQRRFKERNIEVICLVEATDPHTANTFQARHSYTYEDLEFDAQHSPCISIGSQYKMEIDLSAYHGVVRHPSVNVEQPYPFASQF